MQESSTLRAVGRVVSANSIAAGQKPVE